MKGNIYCKKIIENGNNTKRGYTQREDKYKEDIYIKKRYIKNENTYERVEHKR